MKLINTKLKQAREIVGYTQKQLAEYMNLNGHSLISQYESGKLSSVPEFYLEFLLRFNFDLNTLFDNSIKNIQLKKPAGSNQLQEPSSPYNSNDCSSCKEKEKKIFELQAQISLLKQMLQDKENDNKAISA